MSVEYIVRQIDEIRGIMVAVATGGPKIDQVNVDYRAKYQDLDNLLMAEGIENPNPYSDLWKWYGRWSSGDLPTWQSRREYIANMYDPLISELKNRNTDSTERIDVEPTGWVRVDRGVDKIRVHLEDAKNEEDFQGVGLLCREALISLAEYVYESDKHPTLDGIEPSKTDAKRMLEAYIAVELSGRSHEAERRLVKAALTLANDLQHSRTATFKEAALCMQATTTIINLISIISGHLHP